MATENTPLVSSEPLRTERETETHPGHVETVSETRSSSSNFLQKFGAIELENKGSVARDHLALERTFLAWLRTSLAFASIGIAVTQLFRLNTTIEGGRGNRPVIDPGREGPVTHLRHVGKPLGATFLAIAIVVLWIGSRRYFESQHWIIKGYFPASRGSIFLVSFIAASLILTSLVVVLVVDPSQFEKKL